jgi:hypothetical protein
VLLDDDLKEKFSVGIDRFGKNFKINISGTFIQIPELNKKF